MSDNRATAELFEPPVDSALSGFDEVAEIPGQSIREADSSGTAFPVAKSSAAQFGYVPVTIAPRAAPFRKELLQQFEGTIVEVGDVTFSARMKDLTGVPPSDEIIVFEVDEISEHDRERIQVGSVFYWNMGWMHFNYGTRSSYSEFVFRDLPLLSKEGRLALVEGSPDFDDLFEL